LIKKKLPAMYAQFMELAGVDITATPFEVGPTCHYVMGGVELDADTEGTAVPGLFASGEVSGGMHGANRLGGNSLSDLLVFGRRAGLGAVAEDAGLDVERSQEFRKCIECFLCRDVCHVVRDRRPLSASDTSTLVVSA